LLNFVASSLTNSCSLIKTLVGSATEFELRYIIIYIIYIYIQDYIQDVYIQRHMGNDYEKCIGHLRALCPWIMMTMMIYKI